MKYYLLGSFVPFVFSWSNGGVGEADTAVTHAGMGARS
jgi:hypothetical protein